MDYYFSSQGIIHQCSCPYTQAQNGIAERKHGHITETSIALFHHSSLPLHFWFDAIATAIFLINRMPSTVLSHKSPFESLFHTMPDYSSKFLDVNTFHGLNYTPLTNCNLSLLHVFS